MLGIAYPTFDWKTEGSHRGPWTLEKASHPIPMGPDLFFDGMKFDPANLVAYLKQTKVKNMRVPLGNLAKLNA